MSGTPHITASAEDIAPFVLLPGDPKRAGLIARQNLHNVRQVTDVRGVTGFTGKYRGHELSVMGSGMGMPSASIYCHELFEHYGVREIVRIGSCGTVLPELELLDIVVAAGASTDSAMNRIAFGGFDYAAIPDFGLLAAAARAVRDTGHEPRIGNVFTTDRFYGLTGDTKALLERFGILGIDMETAALYAKAAEFDARALSIMTISDHLGTGQALSSEERQTGFDEMIRVALTVFLNGRQKAVASSPIPTNGSWAPRQGNRRA